MADETPPAAGHDLEAEVWNAIAAFEQILEAMPDDHASLEALAHAYEQIGDHTRAKDYLVRLGTVLVEGARLTDARELVSRLQMYAAEDPRAADLVARIEAIGGSVHAADVEPAMELTEVALPGESLATGFSMGEELSLAWNLLESEELSQDEYAGIVQDLTEMSSREGSGTISVLHVLEFRGARNLERILRLVSTQNSAPLVTLSAFEIPAQAAAMLPIDYVIRRGVLVFDLIGTHALVVAMNPADQQLRHDVEAVLGRPCHFFLCLPSEFDKAVTRIVDMTGAAQSQPSGGAPR